MKTFESTGKEDCGIAKDNINKKERIIQYREVFLHQFQIAARLHACIVKLAKQINERTGLLKNSTNIEEFYKNYQKALDILADHPEYSGEGWFENRDYRSNYPFPNLVKLLKESK